MPASNAEWQRLYRLRRDADPTRRAEYLKKKKDKYKADIASHKRKRVGDMNSREHSSVEYGEADRDCADKDKMN